MSKKRKFLVALLSTAVMTVGAFGLAACGGGESATPDAEYYAAYQLYAQAESDAGRTPDAYQTWLENMLSEAKGQSAYEIWKQSPAGQASNMTEEEWLESLKGAAGTGIAGVALSEDGTKLVITYTDPDMPATEIDIGSTFHKHTYGPVTVLFACTEDADGLGYRVCSEDGFVELVKIEKYSLRFILPDGSPAVGYTVTFGNKTATTDDKGVAYFVNDGTFAKTAIDISGGNGRYGIAGEYTSGLQTEYEFRLCEVVDGSAPVTESGTYVMDLSHRDQNGNDTLAVQFAGDEDKNTHYSIAVDESVGLWYAEDYGLDISKPAGYVHELNVIAGGYETVYFSYDPDGRNSSTKYYITVTKSEGPEAGSVVELPLTLAWGENDLTITSNALPGIYSAYCMLAPDWSHGYLTMTFGSDVSVYYYGIGSNAKESAIAGETPTPVASGEVVNGSAWSNHYFLITTTAADGAADVKVEAYIEPGSQDNPIEIVAGRNNNTEATKLTVFSPIFTYECTESGKYVLTFTTGSPSVCYEDKLYNYSGSTYLSGPKATVELTEGKTYYFIIYHADGLYDFTLSAYDAAKDSGYSATDLREFTLTGGEATLNIEDAATTMYFKAPTAEEGAYSVTVKDSSGNTLNSTVTYYNPNKSIVDAYHMSGEGAYFTVTVSGVSDYTLNVSFATNAAKDHVFSVKDESGNAISGANVSVGYYSRTSLYANPAFTAVATGTTDDNGNVTLNFASCDYEIQVTFAEGDEYYLAPVTVSYADDATTKELTAEAATDYTFTFTNASGATVSGLTVSVYEYVYNPLSGKDEAKLVTSAQSGADGVVTIKAFKSLAAGYYTVVTSNDDYYATVAFDYETYSYNVTAQEKVIYTISLKDESGNYLKDVKVSITDSEGTTATAETNGNGVAVMTVKLIPGEYAIKASGYSVKVTTSATQTEIAVTAGPIEYLHFENGSTFTITLEDDADYYIADKDCYIELSGGFDRIWVEVNGDLVINNKDASFYQEFEVHEGDVIRIWTNNVGGSPMYDNFRVTIYD